MSRIALFVLGTILHIPQQANAQETEKSDRLQQLEQRVKELEQQAKAVQTSPSMQSSLRNSHFSLYGSLRPTLEYQDKADDVWDIGDALSRLGVKADTEFAPNWHAIAQGEWKIRLDDNGRFGEARLAFAGIGSPFGQITFGRQRPVQYTLVAEYIDIFNNANSPFGYNQESPFFVNNALIYELKLKPVTVMASAIFDGNSGGSGADTINVGAGFDKNGLHLGAAYLQQDVYANANRTGKEQLTGAVISYEFSSGIYAAVGYQAKDYEFETAVNRTGSTFDSALAIPFANAYKLKLGYFWFKDGIEDASSQDYDGYNLTLEWQIAANVRTHLEYLQQNNDQREDDTIIALGIRYDFDLNWEF